MIRLRRGKLCCKGGVPSGNSLMIAPLVAISRASAALRAG